MIYCSLKYFNFNLNFFNGKTQFTTKFSLERVKCFLDGLFA